MRDDMAALSIATEFSDAPGARYRSDGEKSGEEFFETLLSPRFAEAVGRSEQLIVDLDGTWGYASSFLSESFGRLSREFGSEVVLKNLVLRSEEEPYLVDEIRRLIEDPDAR